MNNGDMPAQAFGLTLPDGSHQFNPGLTKREEFARSAMQGDWASQNEYGGVIDSCGNE